MRYRAVCCTALILAGLNFTLASQAAVRTLILAGECSDGSHTAEGPLGSDLTKRRSRFYCDSAVVTTFDDYRGHTIINFSQKASQHENLLGFAGRMESPDGGAGSTMRVNTVYLKAGEATAVTEGVCKTFYKGKRLSGLMCGAKVDEAGRRTTAIITFDVAPNQSLNFEAQPGFGSTDKAGETAQEVKPETFSDGNKVKTLPNGTKVLILPNGNKFEQLSDGTTWVVLYPNNELLGIRFDERIMPTTSSFRTEVIINLPQSDIVNAPLSERIEVGGECSSMTYTILGTLPYAGKNGGGLPDPDSATDPENVLRRVMPGTLMSHVFDVVCKKP